MARLFKAVLKLAAVLLLIGGAVAVHLIWFRPFSIDLFFERVFIEFALDDPELLTTLRLLEPYGLNGHNEELTDASPRRLLELHAKIARDLETLRAYDREGLQPGQQLSYDVLEYYLAIAEEGAAWDFHNYPVNSLNGVQSTLPAFLASDQRITDKSEARQYIARLEKIPQKFAQVRESLVYRDDRGIAPPRFVIDRVLAEMSAFIATRPQDNLLYTSLKEKLDPIDRDFMDPVTKRRMLNRVEKAIKEQVYPAYRDLIAYFQSLQQQVDMDHGAWGLPEGEALYAYLVRRHTTTELTPDEVHLIGLDAVARIEAQMDELLRQAGYVDGSVGERMTALCQDPAHRYPDSGQGRRKILADYQAMVDEASEVMADHFHHTPASPVEVLRVPEFRESTSPVAYYRSPSLDGARPGRFFVNLRDVNSVCKPAMRTLAYHEAIPGHHFQIALAQELTGVPTFRRLIPFTAYTEGWALYAERLAFEAGLLADPLDDLGRLQAEMFRAARLVVDTGLHHQRWSMEEAGDYLRDKTGYSETDVAAEIERYMINPGQALAYYIGFNRLLELRERARSALGDGFDAGAFHAVVLGSGSLPLPLVERQVEAWIAAR